MCVSVSVCVYVCVCHSVCVWLRGLNVHDRGKSNSSISERGMIWVTKAVLLFLGV